MIADARDASRLIYFALQAGAAPAGSSEYDTLLIRYRSQSEFESLTKAIARGLELEVLEAGDRGLILVPASKESRFSVRLSDLRQMTGEQRVALAIAYLTIAAVFFPTNDRLEDDSYVSRGEKVNVFRDTLASLVQRLAAEHAEDAEVAGLEPGWLFLNKLPVSTRTSERASLSTLDGCVKLALNQMRDFGMVKVSKPSVDEDEVLYTPTHRLRIHVRDMTERMVFSFICSLVQADRDA